MLRRRMHTRFKWQGTLIGTPIGTSMGAFGEETNLFGWGRGDPSVSKNISVGMLFAFASLFKS